MADSLLDALKKHLQRNYVSFHMPGHQGKGMLTQLTHLLGEHGLKTDLTELPGLDNLQEPVGPILAGEEQAAGLMGAKKSFFLVNGATGGILAGMLAASAPGDRVLFPRNSHRALWSALVLGDLRPVFVLPEVYFPYQIVLPPALQAYGIAYGHTEDTGQKSRPGLLVGINPTYEGLVSNELGNIITWAAAKKMLTIIDEAHGSLFPLHDGFPPSAIQLGADLVVHGTHKTLGSLTQTGLLHLGTHRVPERRVSQALQTIHTTSPSYLLMASLAEVTGNTGMRQVVDIFLHLAWETRGHLGKIKGIKLVDDELIRDCPGIQADPAKLVISALELGLSGHQLANCLREQYRIQVEMACWGYTVLLLGLGTTMENTAYLLRALEDISRRYGQEQRDCPDMNSGLQASQEVSSYFTWLAAREKLIEPVVTPRESFYGETKEVLLGEARGELAGELICPYPPGIPILYPGEIITPEALELVSLVTGEKNIRILI